MLKTNWWWWLANDSWDNSGRWLVVLSDGLWWYMILFAPAYASLSAARRSWKHSGYVMVNGNGINQPQQRMHTYCTRRVLRYFKRAQENSKTMHSSLRREISKETSAVPTMGVLWHSRAGPWLNQDAGFLNLFYQPCDVNLQSLWWCDLRKAPVWWQKPQPCKLSTLPGLKAKLFVCSRTN